MTQLLSKNSHSAITVCLRQLASGVIETAAGCWEFSLGDGIAIQATACFVDAFLLFDAPAPAACELAQGPQWLRWNAALAGNAKIALMPNPWRVRLRAEILVGEETEVAPRVRDTLAGLREACRLLAGDPSTFVDSRHTEPLSSDEDRNVPRNLLALLRETGWAFNERSGGSATVEIASRGDCCRVLLEENAAGVRAAMELLGVAPPAESSRLALAALLLSASGALRLARPYVEDVGERFSCGFAVRITGETTARRTRTCVGVAGRCRLGVQKGSSKPSRQLGGRELPGHPQPITTVCQRGVLPWVNQKPQQACR